MIPHSIAPRKGVCRSANICCLSRLRTKRRADLHQDQAHTYGGAAVQNIDQFGLELFIAGRYDTLTRAFASYHPIEALMTVHATMSDLPVQL